MPCWRLNNRLITAKIDVKTQALVALILAIITLMSGCGALPEKPSSEAPSRASQSLPDSNAAIIKLNAQHKQWKKAPYKLGGLSKKGIDCSGFVHITYKERFGISLPRTTARQAKMGTKITRQQLRAGDLVFFKTGLKVRHVGIYIENGKFLHASTSKGVMISNINNRYWKKVYWKSMRI